MTVLGYWIYAFWFMIASLIEYMVMFSYIRPGRRYVKFGRRNDFRSTSDVMTAHFFSALIVPAIFLLFGFFVTPLAEEYWRYTPFLFFLVVTVFLAWAVRASARKEMNHLGYVLVPLFLAAISLAVTLVIP